MSQLNAETNAVAAHGGVLLLQLNARDAPPSRDGGAHQNYQSYGSEQSHAMPTQDLGVESHYAHIHDTIVKSLPHTELLSQERLIL